MNKRSFSKAVRVRPWLALGALCALLAASACGVRGDLTPAPPIFGAASTDAPAQHAPVPYETSPTQAQP